MESGQKSLPSPWYGKEDDHMSRIQFCHIQDKNTGFVKVRKCDCTD